MRLFLVILLMMSSYFVGFRVEAEETQEITLTFSNATLQLPMVKGHPAKGSLTSLNDHPCGFVILGATMDRARRVELHKSTIEDGISKMRKVDTLQMDPYQEVDFANEGFHFMIFDLDPEIKEGDIITITLEIKHSEALHVPFKVVKLLTRSHQMN